MDDHRSLDRSRPQDYATDPRLPYPAPEQSHLTPLQLPLHAGWPYAVRGNGLTRVCGARRWQRIRLRLRDGSRAALSGHPQAVDDVVDACRAQSWFGWSLANSKIQGTSRRVVSRHRALHQSPGSADAVTIRMISAAIRSATRTTAARRRIPLG